MLLKKIEINEENTAYIKLYQDNDVIIRIDYDHDNQELTDPEFHTNDEPNKLITMFLD